MNPKPKTIDAETVRLSALEVSGLPRRVLSAATMPQGCVGGAAEMVEFLEYAGGGGLVALESIQERLVECGWRAPRVLCEAPGVAFCDAVGESSLHCGPPLADWVSAMAFEEGAAAIGIANVIHPAFLPALAQRLALRGLSGLGLWLDHATPSAKPAASAALCESDAWAWSQFPLDGMPDVVASLVEADPTNTREQEAQLEKLFQLRAAGAEWLAGLRSQGGPLMPSGPSHERSSDRAQGICAVVAVDDRNEPFGIAAKERFSKAVRSARESLFFTSADVAAARRRTTGRGWEVDHDLWASLMAFADRSLIATSEQSRLGAG